MEAQVVDAEALRLLKAFYGVEDKAARDAIIALAEAAGRGAEITTITAPKKTSLSLAWSRPPEDDPS